MELQTRLPLKQQPHNQIDYNSNILLLGSCFSENIGQKFQYYKLQSTVNPLGILFHPLAIENLVTRSINKSYYQKEELLHTNEQWVCLDAHSSLNKVSQEDLLTSINQQIDKTHQLLSSVSHVTITLGTSWVYRYLETDKIIANCHKIPQKKFTKELLTIDEIEESLLAIISLIRSVNKEASIIFTVSPVRHLKDGFIENSRSKSHLSSAVHRVVEPRKKLYYFPAYEIMMDELRDYRFYNQDMIHPNDLAINYIWDKFKSVWFSVSSLEILETVENIQIKLAHRPFNPESNQHKKFIEQLNQDIDIICQKYPHILFE